MAGGGSPPQQPLATLAPSPPAPFLGLWGARPATASQVIFFVRAPLLNRPVCAPHSLSLSAPSASRHHSFMSTSTNPAWLVAIILVAAILWAWGASDDDRGGAKGGRRSQPRGAARSNRKSTRRSPPEQPSPAAVRSGGASQGRTAAPGASSPPPSREDADDFAAAHPEEGGTDAHIREACERVSNDTQANATFAPSEPSDAERRETRDKYRALLEGRHIAPAVEARLSVYRDADPYDLFHRREKLMKAMCQDISRGRAASNDPHLVQVTAAPRATHQHTAAAEGQ